MLSQILSTPVFSAGLTSRTKELRKATSFFLCIVAVYLELFSAQHAKLPVSSTNDVILATVSRKSACIAECTFGESLDLHRSCNMTIYSNNSQLLIRKVHINVT